eukprot:gene24738-biopygen2937
MSTYSFEGFQPLRPLPGELPFVHFRAIPNFTGAPEGGQNARWTPRLTALKDSHRYSHPWLAPHGAHKKWQVVSDVPRGWGRYSVLLGISITVVGGACGAVREQ